MGFSFRPSFTLDVEAPSREVIDRLAAELATTRFVVRRTRPPGGGPDAAQRDRDQVIATVPAAQRHFWSPWLTIEVDPSADHGAHVAATFSPHPSVWTGYLVGYLGLAVVIVLSLLYAASLALSGHGGSPWSLWVAGAAVMGMIAMWWASVVGQRLAQAQMDALRSAVESILACSDLRHPPP